MTRFILQKEVKTDRAKAASEQQKYIQDVKKEREDKRQFQSIYRELLAAQKK